MTRNNPRNQRPCTAKLIGGLSRAKRHGPPIALSAYENVQVSGYDDRDQYVYVRSNFLIQAFGSKCSNYMVNLLSFGR